MASKTEYRLDLVEIFNRTYGSAPDKKKLRNALRPVLSDVDFKRAFGNKVIEEIIDRTENKSIDKFGNPFPKYQKAYMESRVFEIYGKTRKVNLKLTGEMLASMAAKPQASASTVTIRFVDEENRQKALGHIEGINGERKYRRDFFGLPPEAEEKIMKEIIPEYSQEIESQKISEGIAEALKINIGTGGE